MQRNSQQLNGSFSIKTYKTQVDFSPSKQKNDSYQGKPQEKPNTAKTASFAKRLQSQGFLTRDDKMKPSHYNLISHFEDKDIRDLSKVIEKSIVTQMKKGNYALKNRNNSVRTQKEVESENPVKKNDDQYVNHIRYGISCIDTNLELKRFIVKQTEKKQNCKNRLQNDIRIFMDDLIKVKERKQSTSEAKQNTGMRFIRKP